MTFRRLADPMNQDGARVFSGYVERKLQETELERDEARGEVRFWSRWFFVAVAIGLVLAVVLLRSGL